MLNIGKSFNVILLSEFVLPSAHKQRNQPLRSNALAKIDFIWKQASTKENRRETLWPLNQLLIFFPNFFNTR